MPAVQVAIQLTRYCVLNHSLVYWHNKQHLWYRCHNRIDDKHNYFLQKVASQKNLLYVPGLIRRTHEDHGWQDYHFAHPVQLHPNTNNCFSDQQKYGKGFGFPSHKFQVLFCLYLLEKGYHRVFHRFRHHSPLSA